MQRYFAFLPKYVNLKNILLKIRRNFFPFIKNAPTRGGATMTCNERVTFAKCKLYDSFANIKFLSEFHKKKYSPVSQQSCIRKKLDLLFL